SVLMDGQHLDDVRLGRLQHTKVFQEYRYVEMRAPLGSLFVKKRWLRIRQILKTTHMAIGLFGDHLVQDNRLVEGHERVADGPSGGCIRRHGGLHRGTLLKFTDLYTVLCQYVDDAVVVFITQREMAYF